MELMTSRQQSGLWDWRVTFQNELWDLWHHSVEVDCGIDNIYTIVLRLYNFRLDSIMLLWWIVRLMTIMSARRIEGFTWYAVLVNCGIDGITLLNWIVGLTPSCWGFISFVLTVSLFCGELWDWHHHTVEVDWTHIRESWLASGACDIT